MNKPGLLFIQNPRQDLIAARAFAKDAPYDGGRNVQWAMLDKFPELAVYFDRENGYRITDEDALDTFIKEKYAANQDDMMAGLESSRESWAHVESAFHDLVGALFNEYPWPNGDYRAVGTIWGMYPRFLEEKIFLIPFHHKSPAYLPVIIAHEMLHFIFYEYFYGIHPELRESKHNFFVWHVSEIFNALVQNSPAWIEVFKEPTMAYPEHEAVIARLSQNVPLDHIDALIENILGEVRSGISLEMP